MNYQDENKVMSNDDSTLQRRQLTVQQVGRARLPLVPIFASLLPVFLLLGVVLGAAIGFRYYMITVHTMYDATSSLHCSCCASSLLMWSYVIVR